MTRSTASPVAWLSSSSTSCSMMGAASRVARVHFEQLPVEVHEHHPQQVERHQHDSRSGLA